MKKLILLFLAIIPFFVTAQTIDSISIKQVDSLIKVSRNLTGKNDFTKALEVHALAEKIALEKFGQESAAYGSTCFNHGRILYYQKDYPEAEKWYLQSKAIREKVLGKEHPDYAWSLNNLAFLYTAMIQYEKAEPLHMEALAIRGKVLGKEHADYIVSLNTLAQLYINMGQYKKAEPLYLEAKNIIEKKAGKEHADYASGLGNLAILYSYMAQYEKAEPLYLEVKAIREKTVGKEHPDYANSLGNLAILYWYLGQYEKAESLNLEAIAIREKLFGKDPPENYRSIYNLAILYQDMGQYEKAEPLFLKAKNLLEKKVGKEHPDYASALNSLGVLCFYTGQYEKTETYYLEALAIREKVLGKEHEHYSQTISNLALLYWKTNQYEKAEPLYLEAIAIQEKALGKENPGYANSLTNLATLYQYMGLYDKAESLNLEAIAIRKKLLGKAHDFYAQSLNNLATLYMDMGLYEKAEPLYYESKAILEKALGKEHILIANSLTNLATLYWLMGQYEKAETFFTGNSQLNRNLTLKAMHHLSELEMNQYLLTFNKDESNIFSLDQITDGKTGIAKTGYDNTLFFKGFLLNAYNHSKKLILSNTAAKENYNLLMSYGRRLAKEYAKPVAERKGVTELEERSNTLEKEIAKSIAGYGETMKQVKWQDVQQKLKKGEAAIEFVKYGYGYKNKKDSTMYAALLLRPGDEQPHFISLFEERSLDSLLQSNNGLKADYVNRLYSITDRGIKINKGSKTSLYEMLWKPLEKELTGIKKIYFSPSGLLHRINLDAIPVSASETLADKFQLVELNSTRQLVVPIEINNMNKDAVLYGGVDFDGPGDSTVRSGGSWTYLPGTESEVNSLEKIMQTASLKTNVKKGIDATEESFKRIGANNSASPKILHIATHGYFFPDPKEKASSTLAAGSQEPVFKMSDHPMLRSGLILSGGNKGWDGDRSLEGKEDGVLTAYEISQMNLSNTELVILSACETGLGTIQGNEGVYGLQRAFKIAGAKYLIMSLWQVPDKQTSLLMTAFYKKWLTEKKTIPNAFHEAQQQLRESGLDPYYWAGFVLVE